MPTKNFKIMAFYDSLRITGMALATSWILYICATRQGGIVEKAFSSKSLVPLSRISYCVYLVSPLYLVFRDAIITERYYMDRISQIGEFILYLLFSIFAAFIIYIVVEEPFSKMYNILKKRATSSTPPNDATQIGNDTVLNQNGTEKR
nr:nose resistant to fluoxetine protein 6-like [Parasteatoda tepidariorum]